MPKPTLAAFLLLASGAGHAQTNCDTLREQIDAKIRAGGVASFKLEVVDMAASAPGRQVGTCERGSRKIVYLPGAGGGASRAALPLRRFGRGASAPVSNVVITECKDGSMPHDGTCR